MYVNISQSSNKTLIKECGTFNNQNVNAAAFSINVD